MNGHLLSLNYADLILFLVIERCKKGCSVEEKFVLQFCCQIESYPKIVKFTGIWDI